MSYLGFPRLNFAGTFQSDVTTTNNRPQYFDNTLFEPRFQRRMNGKDINGLWHPIGSNGLRMVDVRFTGAALPDGTAVTQDPVLGGWLADDDRRANGKFVDLDPNDQLVPEIYGFAPRVLSAAGVELLRGEFVVSSVEDVWPRAFMPSGRPDISATYQSVLKNLEWADDSGSSVLRALRERTQEGLLSIKFTVDAVEDGIEQWPDNLTYGRIVGSIGLYSSGEPYRFSAARRLRPTPGSPMNHAPCRVDDASGTVFVDLANSIRCTSRGGPLVDLGPLRLATVDEAGTSTPLSTLDGLGAGFLEQRAAIATTRLTTAQLQHAATRRLAVINAEGKPLLAENAGATWVHADGCVFRLHPQTPEDSATTTLYATRFGRPAPGMKVYLGGTPVPFDHPADAVTDAHGRCVVRLHAPRDPGRPRPFIDGATAKCAYGDADLRNEPQGTLSVRVFNVYKGPARPDWVRDVQPIFQQYANLYPIMRHVLDMGNYNDILRHRGYIRRTLLAPMDSPNHMPVTRDLSPGRRDMIVKWLDTAPTPPVLEIDTVEDLRAALQLAALVELAVIPPYLAALFSIKHGHNVKISDLIRGVVLEEMQHLVQVCNILNAVGGRPGIGRPALVPTYPGRLPGPVLPDLRVRLRRLSLQHVKDVFMAIEAPEHPRVDGQEFKGAVIDPKVVRLDDGGRLLSVDTEAMAKLETWFTKAEYTPQTIGWFYNVIARAIIRLDRKGKLFTGDPARQVAWPDAPGTLYQVTDRRSALLGIYQIIEQGEGSPHDLDGDGLGDPEELGHYYRFQEIVEGRQLARDAQGRWTFTGPEIPFDPDGVYPMVDDPDAYLLPEGSAERRESVRCNASYTALLAGLQRVLDGHPGELDNTVGLMFQLQTEAKRLLEMPSAPGAATRLGPAFQSPGLDA